MEKEKLLVVLCGNMMVIYMARGNEKNLIPNTERSPEQLREMARAGGIKSGETRRKKKSIKELVKTVLETPMSAEEKQELIDKNPILSEEDMNLRFGMIMGQAESAKKGNTQAFTKLIELEESTSNDYKDKKIYIPGKDLGKEFVDINRDVDDREHLEYWFLGGRGSLKSSFAGSEKPIELLYNNPQMCIMAIRKVKDTLKDSIYAQLVWAIDKLGLTEEFTCTKSPMEITRNATGQKIFFRGADDPTKIKSTKPPVDMYIGIVIYEEFDQMAGMNEIRTINQSIIRGGEDFVLFYICNTPKSLQHFVNKEAIIHKPNRIIHRSTYLDVPKKFLGQVFIDEAEYLKQTNIKAYEHEYLGIANGTGGSVFENVTIKQITNDEIKVFDRLYYGLDFGWYPDPNAFTEMYYNSSQKKLYIFNEIKRNKTSNEEMAELLKDYKKVRITADSAENKSIANFVSYGFDMRGAIKRTR